MEILIPARTYREGAKVAATCYARFRPSAAGGKSEAQPLTRLSLHAPRSLAVSGPPSENSGTLLDISSNLSPVFAVFQYRW